MVLQKDRIQPFTALNFPLPWQFEASTWVCSLIASVLGKSFRHFSRPACAADSLGLLKYTRALQSPREGVESNGRRDLISNGSGEVSRMSLAGPPFHPELVPHLVPVSALPRRSKAWALCRRGFFLQRKPRGRKEKRSWAWKISGRRWGGRGKAAIPKRGPPSGQPGGHRKQLARDPETGPPK